MKTLKEFYESAVIRLKGFDGSKKVHSFLDELDATSKFNPFNDRQRVLGAASVHVSRQGDGIHLHDILSHDPKSGAGTQALTHLTKLADKHGVKISGIAKGYTKENNRIGTSKRLKTWYEKHGFKSTGGSNSEGYNIEYHPNTK